MLNRARDRQPYVREGGCEVTQRCGRSLSALASGTSCGNGLRSPDTPNLVIRYASIAVTGQTAWFACFMPCHSIAIRSGLKYWRLAQQRFAMALPEWKMQSLS